MIRKSTLLAMMVLVLGLSLTGTACFGGPSDADVASKNLSTAAEQFEVPRRIVAFNGITDKYLLVIEGFCSIEAGEDTGVAGALEVICKSPEGVRKFYVGLSDNVSYFVQQGKPTKVSTSRFRVIFKPEAIVPNFDRP